MADALQAPRELIRRFAGPGIAGLLVLLTAAVALGVHPPPDGRADPVARAVQARVSDASGLEPWIRSAYAERGFRPLWGHGGRPSAAARRAAAAIAAAGQDGLDGKAYDARGLLAAADGAPASAAEAAKADIRLTRAFALYVADLHGAHARQPIYYADPSAKPALADARRVAQGAARARLLDAYVADALRMNPIYVQLRADLRRRRGRLAGLVKVSAAPAPAPADDEALIRANMDRVRGLPPDLGSRYVLVNIAAQTLWYYDHGRRVGSMRVIVGKTSEQTPQMAGVIRYLAARPYWNIPPDLVRDSVAPKVMAGGRGYLDANQMEALSDWSDRARVLDPAMVDWAAVAAGRQELRMRQRPGARNMMGEVKFMFPNALGVYLHDTPLKALFDIGPRTHSAGCVRLEHADQLAHWIMGAGAKRLSEPGPPEQALVLDRPVPVYLVYLTADPDGAGGLTLADDVYHRDPVGVAATAKASAR